jgi:YbbR domain-containing protein
LTKNLSLKIIAVLFAVGLWLISININDPYQSKSYSVTVQLQNLNTMVNAGKYVEVADDSDEITVSVRASRTVMDSFSASNIIATADLNEIDEQGQVPIKLSTTKTSSDKIESVRSDRQYVRVNVEDIYKVQKRIEIVTKNEPESGYILGKASTEQNALKISGPESVVSTVAKAVVTVDLDGATDDLSMLLPIELYDEDGGRISDSRLTTSIDEVQCVATILATAQVPVNIEIKGEAAAGYGYTGIVESDPAQVTIAAKSSQIRSITSINVEEPLDITNATDNVEVTVDLRKYLPDGVSLADSSFTGKAKLTAYVEKKVTRTLELDADRIELVNLPENTEGQIHISETSLSVELTGLESVMNELDEAQIRAYIDAADYMEEHQLTALDEGSYTMDIVLELPDGVSIEGEADLQGRVTITKK